MGRRGPLPKPTAVKQLAGNPGKRTLSDGEPAVPTIRFGPPAWLTDRAREIWGELAPILEGMKVLTIVDRRAFGRYCQLHARWEELDKERATRGWKGWSYAIPAAGGKSSYVAVMPQAAEERTLLDEISKLEQSMGLTPSARTRIRVEPTTPGPGAPTLSDEDQERQAFFAGGGPAKPRASTG